MKCRKATHQVSLGVRSVWQLYMAATYFQVMKVAGTLTTCILYMHTVTTHTIRSELLCLAHHCHSVGGQQLLWAHGCDVCYVSKHIHKGDHGDGDEDRAW